MVNVREVDYRDGQDARALVDLLNQYAQDPFGGNAALPDQVQAELCGRLAEFPGACSFLAEIDETPVGLINTFTGFSTFYARPLINIHDVYISAEARGKGVLEALFAQVEARARALGCCKITLEVLRTNERAQRGYNRLGFSGYSLGDSAAEEQRDSDTLFWQKKLV